MIVLNIILIAINLYFTLDPTNNFWILNAIALILLGHRLYQLIKAEDESR